MNTYECFYEGKRATIAADSLVGAKDKAVAHFKPAKSKRHMVSVILVAKPDGAVALNNSNADFG